MFKLIPTLFFALPLLSAFAADFIILPTVGNYEIAGEQKHWKGVGKDQLPKTFIKMETMEFPSQANQNPHTGVILQNERAVVCYEDCSKSQPVRLGKELGRSIQLEATDKKSDQFKRVTNAYFWINKFFDRLDKFGYQPTKQLEVIVDYDHKDVRSAVRIHNNAYFQESKWTLRFLPSRASFFARAATKVNPAPSSHDPSVIIHETMHSVFEDIFSNYLNDEIYGVHEAVADYFALSMLNSTELGQMMFRGHSLRKATQTKEKYSPGMEEHALGEILLQTLWKLRAAFLNHGKTAEDADAYLFKVIISMAQNPFAIANDLPELIRASAGTLDNESLKNDISVLDDEITSAAITPTTFTQTQTEEAYKKTTTTFVHEITDQVITQSNWYDVKPSLTDKASLQAKIIFKNYGPNGNMQLVPGWYSVQTNASGRNILAAEAIEFSPYGSLLIDPIQNTSHSGCESLKDALSEWKTIRQIATKNFGSGDVQELFNMNNQLIYAGNTITKENVDTVLINGTTHPVTKKTRIMRKSLDGMLFEWISKPLDMDELKAAIREIRSISYLVVGNGLTAVHPEISRLNFDSQPHNIAGYEVKFGSGLVQRFLIKEIKD